jgi:hypothetical protein
MNFTTPEVIQTLLAVMGGISLAAACGFRVFLPMLVLSLASKGGVVSLGSGFEWLSSTPALITFGVASVLEVGAFYIPWVDHTLDAIAAPASIVAGTLAVASQVSTMDSWMTWVVGIIAGGGTAGLVQGATMLTRGLSLVTTGGLGNPIVSTAENALAVVVAALAVFLPLLALVLVMSVVAILVWRWQVKRSRMGLGRRAAIA